MGTLTRNDMERVIREGGSVLLHGRLYTRIEELPTDAELARGNPALETAAASALQQQIAGMQAQLQELQQRQSTAPGGESSGPAGPGRIEDLAPSLVSIVGQELADRLVHAGYPTPTAIREASDKQLLDIDGIGQATLKRLREVYGTNE